MGNELIILFNIYMLKHVSVKIWAEKMFCSGKRQLVELNGRQNSHWNEIKLQRNSDSVTEMQIKLKDVFIYPVWLNCFSFLRWWRCVYQAKLMQTANLARKAANWRTFSKNRSPPIWTKQFRHRLTLPINAATHPCKATFSFWHVILV